ncbi:LOW QUALITY PROTEIN: ankyrin repeat-containing protein BDA1 [Pyrus x bretschneideri]|uniref:LOW QUALITY PROTEIN: ankyrin repeat-containing protein BDA1 n=1 Tax=Pyrus x bretschneideri TaxID=225117 RepID=UPI00203032A2|nr:LOW QUALITY PROTEIN: ankyrin repeat-containing protein BDA1 [Pyrus x bretschneideri]
MEARLFDTSQTGDGDVQLLHQLLAGNPLLLHSLALTSTENPLHVASIAGHVDFVKEIVRLKPDYVEEMNQDGFSPMHIASANGYLEIVMEMLRVDWRLCRLHGRDEWTPLHYATSRGRVDVVREMVLACPESVEEVTVQGETVIHLAVKCSQFKAIKFLVEPVAETNKVNILNMKDKHGYSVLHLATCKNQHQVGEGLVGNETIAGALEVNSVNNRGLTALDLVFPNETGDWEMEAILHGAGALRAGDIVNSGVQLFNSHSHSENHTAPETPQLQQEQQKTNWWEFFQFKKGRDCPRDARTALLVVASLVAMTTFQVGLNPPNGTWQDSSDVNNKGTGSSNEPVHLAGRSIMGSYSEVSFVVFVVLNSIGFYFSLYTMIILTTNFPLQLELQICIIAVYTTYGTAVVNIAPSYNSWLFITVFTSVLPFLVGLAAKWARHPVTIWLTKPLGKWIHRFFELIGL